MSEDYRLEIRGPIATLTFTREHRANAYHARMAEPLRQDLCTLRHSPHVRCLVVRSAGRHFMAGGDLEQVTNIEGRSPAELTAMGEAPIDQYNRMLRELLRLEVPVIAGVRGAVVGMAIGLLGACDLVIASETTFFEAAHVRSGGSSDGMLSYFLPRQIGLRKALEVALLGDRIDAAEAKRLDLINFLVPDAELEARCDALATRLAAGPTRAYAKIKQLMYASFSSSFEEQGRREAESYGELQNSADLREGIRAFFEKRAPKFEGR
jgi:2-(1,2-epoxy-1,2-dihydrophenyl)acetyl-CoA isomerase